MGEARSFDYKETLKQIATIVPEVKKDLKISVLGGIFYEALRLTPIILLKYLVDMLTIDTSVSQTIIIILIAITIAYLSTIALNWTMLFFQFQWIIDYEALVIERTKKKLLSLGMHFHESSSTGRIVAKISKASKQIGNLLWFTFNEFMPTILQMCVTFFLLLFQNWILAAIFAVLQIPIVILTTYSSKKVQPFRRKYHEAHDKAIGELAETLFNITTVKDYVKEKEQFSITKKHLKEYRIFAKRRWISQGKYLYTRDALIAFGRASTLALSALFVVQGQITAGSLVLVYSLTERAFLSSFRIGRLFSFLEDSMEPIDNIAQIMKQKPRVVNSKNATSVKKIQGEIEFKDVSFNYNKDQENILKHISFTVPKKSTVALVGKSGAGKSTIIKLLLRNYDTTDGTIFIDKKPIDSYKINSYKQKIAVVSQNVEVFNRSILQNISFAKPTASKNEIIAAAKKAYAHDFIKKLADGYDTIVGEKGVKLSGGQKQRISIARALLANPDIFIFDEATSSLDSESEQFIQESMLQIAKHKTSIIIAHRLSTIKHADNIIVLEEGNIIEQGSYKELSRKKNGSFAKMVKLQNLHHMRN